jgi:hypothetical protein
MEFVLKFVIVAFLLAFCCLFLFSLVIFAVHHKTGGAMFVPTPKVMVAKIMGAVDFAAFRDIRELGAGDGRFFTALEKKYHRPVTGYEVNPIAYAVCLLKIGVFRLRSRVRYQSFWDVDLGEADCTFCYLFPDIMPRLGEKLRKELKPGALVISANFPFPGWRPEAVLKCENTIFNDPIYLYRVGSQAG